MNRLRKFSLKYFFTGALMALLFLVLTWESSAQRIKLGYFGTALTAGISDTIPPASPQTVRRILSGTLDTLPKKVVINPNDTIPFTGDSSAILLDSAGNIIDTSDRVRTDTFSLKLSKDSLEAPVQYSAEDSVVVKIKDKKIILYGKTKTDYQSISLTAPKVEIDQQTQILTAFNSKDSTGAVVEDAKFADGEQEFTSDTIQYNFKTQKGLTKNTITQSGEIFVHGRLVKKVDKDVTFVRDGFFTTCNLDVPHFGFLANKLKVINKKVAVSGPAHPEFEGVPIPIYIPFGFYPLTQGRHSGLLPVQFETNDQMGIALTNVGYYKVINDNWDVKAYGNVYSYGSWSANVNPTYYKRYHYRGTLNFGLQKTKRYFKGDPDAYSNNSYTLMWSHASDSKARPGVSFSANVNASSTTYNQNVPNNPNINFQNQLGSSITYSKTWIDKPYNLTVSANHTQNNQTRLVNLSIPDVGFTMTTIYPFQKKDFVGTKKWYEQLGVGYNGSFRNQVSFYDTAFRLRRIIDTLQWGAQHNIPISLSLPPILNGALNISPSISYSQVWLAQKYGLRWNPAREKVDTMITKGFFVDQQASFGLTFNTAVYGTYTFKNSRVVAIRHVIRPSLGVTYRPDLSSKYYDTVTTNKSGYVYRYGMLRGIYSGYGEGRTGGLTFQLDNNLEMKLRPKKDTGQGTTKIRLIDGYGFSSGYNFLRDSLKLEPVNFYFRTNLFQKININASAVLDPYKVDSFGQDIDKYAWEDGKFKLGRLRTGQISMSTSFQSKPRDPEKDKKNKEQMDQQMNDPLLAADRQRLLDYIQQNPAEFVDFNIPWSISVSYSLNFFEQLRSDYSGFDRKVRSSANFNGSFSLTPKWNFSVNGYYDFETKKLQTFSMSINREMHCWQMSINVTPVGPYRFFNFTLSPKSSILSDLRINRTRSFFAGY